MSSIVHFQAVCVQGRSRSVSECVYTLSLVTHGSYAAASTLARQAPGFVNVVNYMAIRRALTCGSPATAKGPAGQPGLPVL